MPTVRPPRPALRLVRRAATLTAVLSAGFTVAPAAAQTLTYPNFGSTAGLQLNGNAAQNGQKLRLTQATTGQGGSAFSTTRVTLNSTASFSTFFSFEILGRGGVGDGADGLTFTLQTAANNVGGAGGGLGYDGLPGNSVAVEFDTFDNGEAGGSNHVGVDLNGSVNSVASTGLLTPDFDNGNVWYAWVDYNGATQTLEARWAQTAVRPVGAGLSYTRDLAALLGSSDVFVGFTAATGSGYGEHNILSWNFVNAFQPGGATPPTSTVPEPGTWALTLAGLAGVAAARRRGRPAGPTAG